MFNNYLQNLFSTKISVIFLVLIGVISIFISRYVYHYDFELSKQDARSYILMAENINSYFYINQQEAMRILPSLMSNFFMKIFSIDYLTSFRIISYFFYVVLLNQIFFFFKKFEVKNYLAFTSVLIIVYWNNSIVYNIFNPFQSVDLLLYIFAIYIIQFSIFLDRKKLFIFSFLALFTKEFLIVLVLLSYFKCIFINKKRLHFDLIYLVLIFLLNFNFAGSLNQDTKISQHILTDISLYKTYIDEAHTCLFMEKKLLYFLPFLILLLNLKFIKFLKTYQIYLAFTLIPIGVSIFLYSLVGNNFFRVYYQGYFIFVIFALIFISKNLENQNFVSILYFCLPLAFIIDFMFLFFNIDQTGFSNYYNNTRFEYFSGYISFSLLFIIILLKLKIKNEILKN